MISQYLGFDSDFIIIGVVVMVLILLILVIVNIVQMNKMKKNYKIFMTGKTAENLEAVIEKRFEQIDSLIEKNTEIEKSIEAITQNMKLAYQKMGLVKYDAFQEMGGKLSFSLAMLDDKNTPVSSSSFATSPARYTPLRTLSIVTP